MWIFSLKFRLDEKQKPYLTLLGSFIRNPIFAVGSRKKQRVMFEKAIGVFRKVVVASNLKQNEREG